MIFISIIFFIISPIISLPIIILGIIFDKKNKIGHLILLAIDIAILSYYFEPGKEYDLYKYFIIMNEYSKIDFMTFAKNILTITEPAIRMIFFLVSKTQNYYLLSAICTFFVYFIVFYMINDYSKKINLKGIYTFLIVIFFISCMNYINFASGLRNGVAIAVFAFAIYLEYVKNKKKIVYKLLYIIPCLLHKSLFIAILIRIFMNFDSKKMKKIYSILMIIIFLSSTSILFFANILSNIPIFSTLYEKAIYYIGEEERNTILNASSLSILNLIIVIFITTIYNYNKKFFKDKIDIKIYNVISYIVIFILAMLSYLQFFARFSFLLFIIGLIPLMDYLKLENKKLNFLCTLMLFFIIMGIGIVGQYATLKNISFGNLFNENIAANIFTLIKK